VFYFVAILWHCDRLIPHLGIPDACVKEDVGNIHNRIDEGSKWTTAAIKGKERVTVRSI
jgi:hypothetical protein